MCECFRRQQCCDGVFPTEVGVLLVFTERFFQVDSILVDSFHATMNQPKSQVVIRVIRTKCHQLFQFFQCTAPVLPVDIITGVATEVGHLGIYFETRDDGTGLILFIFCHVAALLVDKICRRISSDIGHHGGGIIS